jgi:hypothetical protein
MMLSDVSVRRPVFAAVAAIVLCWWPNSLALLWRHWVISWVLAIAILIAPAKINEIFGQFVFAW